MKVKDNERANLHDANRRERGFCCMKLIVFLTEDTVKDWKERMQEWWQGLEFKEMEQVTGSRQTDFSPEDGYQEFVDVCEEWWNGKSYDEKRIIWKKYHNEE